MRIWQPEGGAVIKSWTKDIEDEAVQQLENTSRMPFIFKHVAVMADCHFGNGSTVGSVVATKDAIMPACVGVDLGCGMAAIKLPWINVKEARDKQWDIYKQLERRIPTGQQNNSTSQQIDAISILEQEDLNVIQKWHDSDPKDTAKRKLSPQLGTLGGGNHFIELCESIKGETWLVLHSGSRGLGNILANHHIDIAKSEMKAMFINLPDPDLAYFVRGKPEFAAYIRDMTFAQHFAKWNRKAMLKLCVRTLRKFFDYQEPFDDDNYIDCHHNFVEIENHFGSNVYVTRKGAVRARSNDFGIIPGSMGTRSFIVKGKGSVDSFHSCSHGAGRAMSRSRARKSFTEGQHQDALQGIACNTSAATLDETPEAYKKIEKVMEEQADLVEVVEELKQFVCVKGTT